MPSKFNNPFTQPRSSTPWWLRAPTQSELSTHKRLTKILQTLTNEVEKTNELQRTLDRSAKKKSPKRSPVRRRPKPG